MSISKLELNMGVEAKMDLAVIGKSANSRKDRRKRVFALTRIWPLVSQKSGRRTNRRVKS